MFMYLTRIAADEPLGPDFETKRGAWIDKRLAAGAPRGLVWDYAYAAPALSRAEADAALAALGELGPPTSMITPALYSPALGLGLPDADIGRVQLLAGKVDDAVLSLKRAVASCTAFMAPVAHTRAMLDLGRALEQKGDTRGACEAYAKVLARWGRAKPKSVTADAARERARALGCPP
jgi:serine/threonine-protein kinase